MCLNDIGNDLFKVPGLLFFLSLQLLEPCGIFKHLLRIVVSILIKLLLISLFKGLDLLFSDILSISLVLHQTIVSVTVLKLGTGEFFLELGYFLVKFPELLVFLEVVLVITVEFIVKLLFILSVAFNVLFIGKDLIREWETFTLSLLAFWVTVFHIMDDEAAVITCREEVMVIVTELHS